MFSLNLHYNKIEKTGKRDFRRRKTVGKYI